MFITSNSLIVILLCISQKVSSEMDGFIVGGAETSIDKYPHSAFLDVNCASSNYKSTSWICGSSIINQFFTLTAAHCLTDCDLYSEIYAIVGNADITKGYSKLVEKFKINDSFDEYSMEADIALVKLKQPLRLRNTVQRIILTKTPPVAVLANLAGWGIVDVS